MAENDLLAGWDIPEDWSVSARDAFANIIEERPDLSGSDLAALEQACNLITSADALDSVAREAGYVAIGSTGQTVAHPCAAEARLSRTSAATIFARLSPTRSQRSTEKARTAARARWNGAR